MLMSYNERSKRIGVEKRKDDGCGGCTTPLNDIHNMQKGIDATGRKIFFSTESSPPLDVISKRPDLYGNTHRVGHDIMADWHSILSMVDIASNLHQWAHNDTGHGGFFNDCELMLPAELALVLSAADIGLRAVDMIEIGNQGDFKFDRDMILTHFTYWIIIKSNLLLSTLLNELPASILAILKNKEALAVHQDSWGKQGRRVLSTPPPNILLGPDPTDAILALARCDATKAAQKFTLDNVTGHLWTEAMSNLPGNNTGNQKWCVGGNSSENTSNLHHNLMCRDGSESGLWLQFRGGDQQGLCRAMMRLMRTTRPRTADHRPSANR